jgi:hypothetical protein
VPVLPCPGQFPADVELNIENTEFSPFDQARQRRKLPADLEPTAKSVERTAEAIGEDIARRELPQIHRAMQLDLPMVVEEPIPMLYVQTDGAGVP